MTHINSCSLSPPPPSPAFSSSSHSTSLPFLFFSEGILLSHIKGDTLLVRRNRGKIKYIDLIAKYIKPGFAVKNEICSSFWWSIISFQKWSFFFFFFNQKMKSLLKLILWPGKCYWPKTWVIHPFLTHRLWLFGLNNFSTNFFFFGLFNEFRFLTESVYTYIIEKTKWIEIGVILPCRF